LLIAAQALRHDLVLVSNNLREFSRIPDLRLETWAA
ncbi:MAG TPA: VapC toxin family PIN domain ribonuclease, partial [Calditrichia bacterium]|nr:VapC toxin family PIN domain ribonuclease [Calditrichia bacterium]